MTEMSAALNRLCKWRSVLTGWHLGTKAANAPGVAAMRDLQHFRLIVRAEVTAVLVVLVDKGVCTPAELEAVVAKEAELLELQMQAFFPGYYATDEGIVVNPQVARETNRVRGFPP